jgi:hypothetical protein
MQFGIKKEKLIISIFPTITLISTFIGCSIVSRATSKKKYYVFRFTAYTKGSAVLELRDARFYL